MVEKSTSTNVMQMPTAEGERMVLNEAALGAARRSLEQGAVTPSTGPWREDIIKLLNDALATELVCVLRYKRHYFTADGVDSAAIAGEFLVHAGEESGHADRLAQRIVQLGGEPDFSPDSLTKRSHADYDWFLKVAADPRVKLRRADFFVASFGLGGASSQLERGEKERHIIQNLLPMYRQSEWMQKRIEAYQELYLSLRLDNERLSART